MITLFDIDDVITKVNRDIDDARQAAHDATVRIGVLVAVRDQMEKFRAKYLQQDKKA